MLQQIFLRNVIRSGFRFSRGLFAGAMLVLLLTSISCTKSDSVAKIETSNSQHTAGGEHEAKPASAEVKRSDSDPPTDSVTFVEQGLERLSSPFTKPTVLKLNEIVSRSLGAIDKFDDLQRLASIDQSFGDRLKGYVSISKNAKEARIDMKQAVAELRESGEKHNASILAAMIQFVDRVDDEIEREIDLLKTDLQLAAAE